MGEFDAAGEVVTGALLGRALEPGAGEHGEHGSEICLNCGTALFGPHCHRCGQTGHLHRSLGAIGHEILHGVVHFEGKLWRTLPLLAWRPGELTRRYIEGERARFVSPIALFLFSIFTMFAVFQMMGIGPPADLGPSNLLAAGYEQARKDAVERRDDAIEARAEGKQDAERLAKYTRRIAEAETALKEIDAAQAQFKTQAGKAKAVKEGPNTGWAFLDHGVEKWQKNPALMLYKLQNSSYKFSWLLIPLSLPFVWLLFCWRREYHLYDHMVFVTYSIAFMSLLFIALTIAAALGMSGTWLSIFAVTIPLWHIPRQLRGAYRLGKVSTVLRTIFLLVFIGIVIILFLLALLALGMLG